jgi:hypothetical protein
MLIDSVLKRLSEEYKLYNDVKKVPMDGIWVDFGSAMSSQAFRQVSKIAW